MNKAYQYATQSLGHTGFAILTSSIAAELRPDLWRNGLDASGDFLLKDWREQLLALPGTQQRQLKLTGIEGPVKVLTRSLVRIEERVEEVTGRKCQLLPSTPAAADESEWSKRRRNALETDKATTADAVSPDDQSAVRPRARATFAGDLWLGVQTRNGTRTCGDCAHLSAGHTCIESRRSLLTEPLPRAPRRCLAFKARFEGMDSRSGEDLWPELAALQPPQQGS